MPDLHIIPEGEEHLHTESMDCPCEPEAHVDVETGVMAWIHKRWLALKSVFRI